MRSFILKTTSVLACAVAPFMASQAQAQGDGYVGVSAGYGWSKADVTTQATGTGYFATSSVTAINDAGIQKVKPAGALGGIDAGYDFHSGKWVFGVAADLSWLHNSDSASTTVTYPCCSPTTFTVDQRVSTKWLTTARARIGYDVGGAVLYATGGYAGVKARYAASFTDTFASALEGSTTSKFRSGWVLGGGADIKLAPNWSVEPEYLHADFGSLSAPDGSLSISGGDYPARIFTHDADLKANIVRVGFHYHF